MSLAKVSDDIVYRDQKRKSNKKEKTNLVGVLFPFQMNPATAHFFD